MEKKKKKFSFWKLLLLLLAALLVLALILLPKGINKIQDLIETKASILTGTVERGTVERNLSGTGTLCDEDAVEITVPTGVQVTEYLVEEGEYVTAGTPLARVDKTSVMQTISTIQENLDYVAEEMSDIDIASTDGSVKAQVGGRVMRLFAGEGESVREVMDRDGALALLSLDGWLAADIPLETEAKPGDPVNVTYENGKQAGGKIETIRSGVATVIVPDDKGSLDETVTAENSEGVPLGEGQLYIHSEWRAVAYSGIVKKVSSQEGRKVTSGTVLFQLKDTETDADYNVLANEHREYEEVMARLSALYKDGVVYAESDGCVLGIDDSLIENVAFTGEQAALEYLVQLPGEVRASTILPQTLQDDPGGNDPVDPPDPGPGGGEDPEKYTGICYVITSLDGGLKVMQGGEGSVNVDGSGAVYETSLEAYTGEANIGWVQVYQIVPGESGPTLAVCYPFQYDVVIDAGEIGLIKVGNIAPKNGPGNGGGFSGGGGFSIAPVETFEQYEISPVTLMEVVPQEKVSITITVDELDILSVHAGQEATVTVDALPGRSFSGTVEEIYATGSNSGGNTKFTAKVVMDRQANMLAGMNASCSITLAEYSDILLVPAEAVEDQGTKSVIYTGYDEKTEQFINPVEVETGVSDGVSTQILSGLSEGQKFMYAYFDTLAISSQLAQLPGPGGSFNPDMRG